MFLLVQTHFVSTVNTQICTCMTLLLQPKTHWAVRLPTLFQNLLSIVSSVRCQMAQSVNDVLATLEQSSWCLDSPHIRSTCRSLVEKHFDRPIPQLPCGCNISRIPFHVRVEWHCKVQERFRECRLKRRIVKWRRNTSWGDVSEFLVRETRKNVPREIVCYIISMVAWWNCKLSLAGTFQTYFGYSTSHSL